MPHYTATVQIPPWETDDNEPADIGVVECDAESEDQAITLLKIEVRKTHLVSPFCTRKFLALGEGFENTDLIEVEAIHASNPQVS